MIYAIIVALQFHLLNVLVTKKGWDFVVPEGSYMEVSQILFQGLTLAGLLTLAIRDNMRRRFFLFLSVLIGVAMVREFNNHPLYPMILPGYKAIVGLALIAPFFLWDRRALAMQLRTQMGQGSFVLYFIGFAFVVLWAQTLAQRPLLLESKSDRAVEEALELAGYMLMFCGVLEDAISSRRTPALRA